MEIKQKLKKDHNINWEMKQLESSLKYYGKQVTGDKSTFDFKKNFTSN